MCGIGGQLRPLGQPTDRALHHMSQALVHRGPDGEGFFHAPGISLLHRLLRIHSPQTNAGPYLSHDQRWVLSFNGEIYNHQELRKMLDRRNPRLWRHHTDAEILLEGWAEIGKSFLSQINGMFAFALWDKRLRKLTLGRDTMGEKPLYYTMYDNALWFASEVKALKAAGIPMRLDHDRLNEYLAYRYVSREHTLFRGIKKLLPGHLLEVDQRLNLNEFPFETVRFQQNQRNSRNLADLLQDSCALRLQNVPTPLLFLSGGVDSAALASYLPAHSKALTFESEFSVNESEAARHICRSFKLQHEIVSSSPNSEDLLKRSVWAIEEPLGDSIQIPTLALAEAARRTGQRIVFSGDGADEVFAGYVHHFVLSMLVTWHHRLGRTAFALLAGLFAKAPYQALAAVFPYAARFPPEGRQRLVVAMRNIMIKTGMGPSLTCLFETNPDSSYRRQEENRLRSLRDLMDLDLKTWLPDYTLVRTDKLLMSQSLEGRLPFLDCRIVDFSRGLPARDLIRGARRKWILRQALFDRLGRKQALVNKIPFLYDTSKKSRILDPIFKHDLVIKIAREQKAFENQSHPSLLREKKLFSLQVLDLWLTSFEIET